MGATKIEWTATLGPKGELFPGYTFNPWVGCTKVSDGCAHCYAERDMDKRRGFARWGKGQPRRRTSEGYWDAPYGWEKRAWKAGVRLKVFCASLADVFDQEVDQEWREDLFDLILNTPNLDWLLLTKRPDVAREWMSPDGFGWAEHLPNVWLGVSVEDQATADERIPELNATPAKMRFVSYEPALGPVDFRRWLGEEKTIGSDFRWSVPHIDWVIVGGESGPKARPFRVPWARSTILHCRAASTPVFVKQLGAHIIDRNDAGFDGVDPDNWPEGTETDDWDLDPSRQYQGADARILLRDRKGADPAEWREDLRVREFPGARTASTCIEKPQ